jgi:pentatricopeptide repeat protein|tara:strand:+ start:1774 stop:1914 length:141 start_codon:yes stop_codon:yes gene_type:complete
MTKAFNEVLKMYIKENRVKLGESLLNEIKKQDIQINMWDNDDEGAV